MEEEDQNQSEVELIDLDERGNPTQRKIITGHILTHNTNYYIYIVVLTIILYIFRNLFVYNNSKIYYKFKNIEDINRNISESIINLINKKPNARIGIIYGEPLDGVYNYLINKYEKGEISFKDVQFFSFDGICGSKKNSNSSYYHFLTENFLNKIDIQEKNLFLMDEDGYALYEYKSKADIYNYMLELNPLDLQIILFDENGNIGFIDQYTNYDLDSYIVKLEPPFRQSIKYLYGGLEKTPRYGITQGIKNILETNEIIAIGLGEDKAKIVRILTKGVFIQKYPITVLCKHRGTVKVYTDEKAGSLVKEYYKNF